MSLMSSTVVRPDTVRPVCDCVPRCVTKGSLGFPQRATAARMMGHMDAAELIRSVPTDLFLGGEWVAAENGATFGVHDPATGDELTRVADAAPGDALRALDAAVAAGPEWAATPPRERAELLRAVWQKITERADDFALLMTLEMGKALPESRSEVTYGAEFLRWFSEEAVRIAGRYTPAPAGTGRVLVTKQPVGPCLAITPWNFPLAMGTRKIGPALAAGCTIIVKPASETPLTIQLLAQLFDEAGLPKGVLSVLPSSHAGEVTGPLLEDPRLRKLTFTGSTEVGRMLAEKAGRSLLRTSLELGGNAPFVVFEDADLDAAVEGAVAAKLRNGERPARPRIASTSTIRCATPSSPSSPNAWRRTSSGRERTPTRRWAPGQREPEEDRDRTRAGRGVGGRFGAPGR